MIFQRSRSLSIGKCECEQITLLFIKKNELGNDFSESIFFAQKLHAGNKNWK